MSRYGKKSSIKKGYDISILAKEYLKLLPYRYTFLLENDEIVVFRFNKERFYHLLGFHKLKDTTVFNLIYTETISKVDFFDEVLNKNIGYDFIKLDKFIKKEDLDRFKALYTEGFKEITYKDTRFKADLGGVLSNRFKWFSSNTLLETFGNRLVVDYNPDDYDSVIEADKVFYKLCKEADRNINFYVGKNEKNEYYPVTFFLERKKDSVRVKSDGEEQKHLDILCKIVRTSDKDKEVEVVINWLNVRNRLKGHEEYRGHNRLKMYFDDSLFYSTDVVSGVESLSENIEKQKLLIKEMEIELDCVLMYRDCESQDLGKREKAILYFMDMDVDVDNKDVKRKYANIDIDSLRTEIGDLSLKRRE